MAEHEPEGPRRSVMMIPRIVTQFWEHGSPPECALAVMRENQRANPNWRFALLKADDIEHSEHLVAAWHTSQSRRRCHVLILCSRGRAQVRHLSRTRRLCSAISVGHPTASLFVDPRVPTAPPGHPALRAILSTMAAAILDVKADVEASGKQAVLSLTGPRLLTRALGCQATPNGQPLPCNVPGVHLHARDFEGRLIYDATQHGCYRNSTARAQYQHATATVRSAECRAWLRREQQER